jgi:hypothetical protein
MNHAVLLGDSIFDNGVYVRPAPDVSAQLCAHLGEGWRVTLLAVDGHKTLDVLRQVRNVPDDASHIVVSAGGNDALGTSGVLQEPVRTVSEAVAKLSEAQDRFARDYQKMIESVVELGRATSVCTIYDANYPAPAGRIIKAALCLFNDVISRAAFSHGLSLVDLRLVCTEADDYANPIEPSAAGGDKIAEVLASILQKEGRESRCSPVWRY